jgi:hypothetical protein
MTTIDAGWLRKPLVTETGLRHRAVLSVNQQQNGVNHRHYAFNFAAGVGVAGVSTMLMWWPFQLMAVFSPEW